MIPISFREHTPCTVKALTDLPLDSASPSPEFEHSDVVNEIVELTGTARCEVEHRVRMESIQLGWNVKRDAERFHISPHHFDERMAKLYREGDGFIYETLVFWKRPYRQNWTALALERIRKLGRERARVLLLGDGSGNEALYLSRHGVVVDYCEFPGSLTFDFAVRRFARQKATVNVITERASIPPGTYDAVLSFEVLEHLPDPMAELKSISSYLHPAGIALITEAFSGINPMLPTHLKCNLRHVGRLPFMCADAGLCFSWHGPGWKPWEFVKRSASKLQLYSDMRIGKFVLFYRFPRLWRTLHYLRGISR
ncbi:MAG TPA: class I SAM-dependent methyltransferase [Terriglobales bacterium]|nr:class I SAM-dependent methyltransferase [Terriglobales bacterium]